MPSSCQRLNLFVLLAALLQSSACGAPAAPPAMHLEPGEAQIPLVPAGDMGAAFNWRQRVVCRYQDERYEFQAILSHQHDVLKVLFLTPFNTRALLLEQRGQGLRTQYFVPQRLPFPPRFILEDIHRALFRGFQGEDGRSDHLGHGLERLVDSYGESGLQRRQVYTADGRELLLDVRYRPAYRWKSDPPRLIRLKNVARGYSMTVETITTDSERPD